MKLVILDRDGTINPDSDEFVKSPEEWTALPGALEAIARLNHAGFRVVIACDQSGLGRGLFDVVALNAIHTKMHKQLAACGARVDAVFYCPHGPEEDCTCRMPQPGLFLQIGARLGVELQGVAACGDTATYLNAAVAAGCEPHLVLSGKSAGLEGLPLPDTFLPTTQVHVNLAAFADALIGEIPPSVPPASAP